MKDDQFNISDETMSADEQFTLEQKLWKAGHDREQKRRDDYRTALLKRTQDTMPAIKHIAVNTDTTPEAVAMTMLAIHLAQNATADND